MRNATQNANNGENKMGNVLFHWRPKKVDNGFIYVISKFTSTREPQANGRYGIHEVLKTSGAFKTRARAKSAGLAARRYFMSLEA